MKSLTKVLAAVISLATLVAQLPAAQEYVGGFFGSHPAIGSLIAGVSAILALFHNPAKPAA